MTYAEREAVLEKLSLEIKNQQEKVNGMTYVYGRVKADMELNASYVIKTNEDDPMIHLQRLKKERLKLYELENAKVQLRNLTVDAEPVNA